MNLEDRIARLTLEQKEILSKKLKERQNGRNSLKKYAGKRNLVSYEQQRILFLTKLYPDQDPYLMVGALEIDDYIDGGRLECALKIIVGRHESLRTTFSIENGKVYSTIHEDFCFSLKVIHQTDKSSLDATNLQEIVHKHNMDCFSLDCFPLIKCLLVKCDGKKSFLLISMHHIISDAWSIAVFTKELFQLYEDNNYNLPVLNLQYVDYAYHQTEWFGTENYEKEKQYWKNELANAPYLTTFPLDYPRQEKQNFEGETKTFHFSYGLTKKIKDVARDFKCSNYVVLLAIFKLLLFRYTGNTTLILGSFHANRQGAELEKILGFFVNTIPLRSDVDNETTFRIFLEEIKLKFLESSRHQTIPFSKIVELCEIERNLSYAPLVQTVFTMQNTPDLHLKINDINVRLVKLPHKSAKFDLTIIVQEQDECFTFDMEYCSILYSEETIHCIFENYEAIANTLIDNPDAAASRLNIIEYSEIIKLENNSKDYSYIVDSFGNLAGKGVAGEIATVRPLSTNSIENLVNPPLFFSFPGKEKVRLYRTGHYAKYNSSWSIVNTLTQSYDNQLTKTIVGSNKSCVEDALLNERDAEHLRAHLEHKLPKYMIPSRFMLLDKLPLTVNGKIDKNILSKFCNAQLREIKDEYKELLEFDKYAVLSKKYFGDLNALKEAECSDAASPDNFSSRSNFYPLEADKVHRIKSICKELKISKFSFFNALLNVFIMRHTNSSEIYTACRMRFSDVKVNENQSNLILKIMASEEIKFSDLAKLCEFTLINSLNDAYETDRKNKPEVLIVYEIDSCSLDHEFISCNKSSVSLLNSEINDQENLIMHIKISKNDISINWVVNSAFFTSTQLGRLIQRYENLLDYFTENIQASIFRANIVKGDEYQSLCRFGLSKSKFSNNQCIHEYFEKNSELYPDAIAVKFEESSYTYSKLNDQSNKLAHFLRAKGVVPNMLVGICLSRSLNMIVGILGILKAGGAYVPLDPEYPQERINYICSDSEIKIVITSEETNHIFDNINIETISLDNSSIKESIENESVENICSRDSGLSPECLAYVIYTSGSTGNPKGVLVEHANVARLFKAANFEFSSADVWTLFHSISFDFSVWEIWGAFFLWSKTCCNSWQANALY